MKPRAPKTASFTKLFEQTMTLVGENKFLVVFMPEVGGISVADLNELCIPTRKPSSLLELISTLCLYVARRRLE